MSRVSKKVEFPGSSQQPATGNVSSERGSTKSNYELEKSKAIDRKKSKGISIKVAEENLSGEQNPLNYDDKKLNRKKSGKDGKDRRGKSLSSVGTNNEDGNKAGNGEPELMTREEKVSRKMSKAAKLKRKATKTLFKTEEESPILEISPLDKLRQAGQEVLKMENEKRMEVKRLCEGVGQQMVDFALSLCIERFYAKNGPKIICHELRDTWHRIIDNQWMDRWLEGSANLDAAMKKIELDNTDTCLPLNYDTWSKGVLELLPNNRRQSVVDPFIRNDQVFAFDEEKSTLKFTKFEIEESQSYVSSVSTAAVSSDESVSEDERMISDFSYTPGDSGSRLIFGPVKDSDASLSGASSGINSPNLTTLLERKPSVESLSSAYSEGSFKIFDFSKWTRSQCDYFKGSGIFRYHRENSEEALARLKQDVCKADSSTAEHQMLSNEDSNVKILLEELAMDDKMHEFLKDYYDVSQKPHENLQDYDKDIEIIHGLLKQDSKDKIDIQNAHAGFKDHLVHEDILEHEAGPHKSIISGDPSEVSVDPQKTVRFKSSVQVEILKPPKEGHSKTQMKKLWALTSDSMRKVFADQSDVNIEIFEIGGDSLEENESFTAIDPIGENTLSSLL